MNLNMRKFAPFKNFPLYNITGHGLHYRMAGNIGGNDIVRFNEKITVFLLAELNIAFLQCTVSHPHTELLFLLWKQCRLLFLIPFKLKTTTA